MVNHASMNLMGRSTHISNRAISASKLNPAIQTNTATSANRTGFRDFKHLRSRSEPIMCDEELKELVREQAKADAARGVFDWEGQEFTRLREAFISVVSPNRHAIVANHPIMRASLANILFGDVTPNMLMVRHGGEIVAGFDAGRGWSTSTTQAEAERQRIISNVYHDAWVYARYGREIDRSDDNAIINGRGIIDCRA